MGDSKPRVRHLQEVQDHQVEPMRRAFEAAADAQLGRRIRGYVIATVDDDGAVSVRWNSGCYPTLLLGGLEVAKAHLHQEVTEE